MNFNDIRDLDFTDLGNASSSAKVFILAMLVIVTLVLGYLLMIKDQRVELESLAKKESELKLQFERKQGLAANLEEYQQQLVEMKELLDVMLRQLPGKTEMPDLLIDISQTALATGIRNELFEPGAEINKGFYAEKPISIRMLGSYHQFGQFVSGVASLPRVVIMTMSDIELKPVAGQSAGDLSMQGTLKTFRYLDEDELLAQGQTEAANG
ncbi:MAG: type 4a pilus biogenesis protein PilO [Gammaproteobacteria bacterium]|jgi:type IV pilus assembly protein PilO|nr:type 4a pilus biogenesis protein PilO [Gammaproteobacteria bacterium]